MENEVATAQDRYTFGILKDQYPRAWVEATELLKNGVDYGKKMFAIEKVLVLSEIEKGGASPLRWCIDGLEYGVSIPTTAALVLGEAELCR